MERSRKIVLWVGYGTNEPAWARIMSTVGTVFMSRCGYERQDSIWTNGSQTYISKKMPVARWRRLDEIVFGLYSALRIMRTTQQWLERERIALLIVEGPRGLPAVWFKRQGKIDALVSLQNDYLPPTGKWPVRLHRRVNTALNRFVAGQADEVWKLSPRIPLGEDSSHNFVVPIYIDGDNLVVCDYPAERRDIVYFGAPSPDHALDVLFRIANRYNIGLHIVGDSPYLPTLKASAPPNTRFYGYADPTRLPEIARQCFCGYAIYRNTGPQNYSYYGCPSKYFHYLANNLPVLTTNTAFFSQKIEEAGIGRVVAPNEQPIERAILELRDHSQDFHQAITRFRSEWNQDVKKFLAERMAVLLHERR